MNIMSILAKKLRQAASPIRKIKKLFTRRHPLQRAFTLHGYDFVRLGSDYGGWTLIDSPSLQSSTIVSAGLGEDASFDIEFANRYVAKVVIIDPTPRAIEHFHEVRSNCGQGNSINYVRGGRQPVASYDLSKVRPDQLILVEKALWNSSTRLKFYMPKDPSHVSHSISNIAHDYREDTNHIIVNSITLPELIQDIGLASNKIPLLKLDIEGAEIEVIESMLADHIRPIQLLIEFDDLAKPSKYAFSRVDHAVNLLQTHGYSLAHSDGDRNFLFVLADEI